MSAPLPPAGGSDRRTVLKSLAAAGLAVVGLPGLAQAAVTPQGQPAAGRPPEISTLVSGGALDAAFVQGVRTALDDGSASAGTHQALPGLDAASYTQLGRWLEDGEATLLLGLLDDASATLVLDLVRSAGGRVLSVAHHQLDPQAAASQDWARALGRTLVSAAPQAPLGATTPGQRFVSLSCVI